MAEYLEAEHVLAVTSGTAALHLALLAVGVGPGDEVITSPITWPATANVIEHCGATPVFCDVREGDLNIDAALIPALVTERTKAIMPVHLAGQPADLDPILALGLPVIEDAAHAAESRYRGRKVGGISTAACFSLYATKNIAAGEGGLVATNERRDRGRDQEHAPHPAWRRVALRPGHGGVQGEPLGRARGDRARPARPRRGARGDPASASSRSTTRGSRGSTASRRSSAIPATRTRCTSTRCGSTRRRSRRDARCVPARAHRRADRHEHPLPAGASPDLVPRALPRPAAPAGRRARRRRGAVAAALARAFGRRHPRRRRLPSAACTRGSRHEGAAGPAAVARQAPASDPDRRHADDARGRATSCSRSTSTRRGRSLTSANLWWFALAVTIMIVTALPMAKRWQWLLAAQGIDRPLLVADPRVLRLVHGRARSCRPRSAATPCGSSRSSKRHPGRSGDLTAIVIIERGLGGAATVLLGAVGFVLAIGHYDVTAYLWLEGAFVFGTILLIVALLLPLGAAAAREAAAAARAAPRRASAARRSTTACTTTAATPACCSRCSCSRPRSRRCGSSRSGRRARPSGSTSARASTT